MQYIIPIHPNVKIIDIPISPANLISNVVGKSLSINITKVMYIQNKAIKAKVNFFSLGEYTVFPIILKIIDTNKSAVMKHIKNLPISKLSLGFTRFGSNVTKEYMKIQLKNKWNLSLKELLFVFFNMS